MLCGHSIEKSRRGEIRTKKRKDERKSRPKRLTKLHESET